MQTALFFIENRPAFAAGIGEKLQPIDLTLRGVYLVLVKPPFAVGTKEAYEGIKPAKPHFCLSDSIGQPLEKWQDIISNDFEASVFPHFPKIAQIKGRLLESGAFYTAMSGTGSSVFGLFKNEPAIKEDDFPADCFIWKEWISE